MKINLNKISIIGLGKVGTCLAVSFASKGFKVYVYDVNSYPLRCLESKKALYYEPNLQYFLNNYHKNIIISDLKEISFNTDITIFIVQTPSKKDGGFSNKYLVEAVSNVSKEIKNKKSFHIFVIASTVSPLSINNEIIPIIEKTSKKKLNKDFGVIYNPQFIALGSVIKNILEPDFVLVGESDQKVGDILEKIYKKLLNNNAPICRMSIVSAEIAKIAFNCFTTIKMSFTNFLGNVCETIPEANIYDIMSAITNDKRIIGKFGFRYGVAYGGPCLPRDNRALIRFIKKFTKFKPNLFMATDKINNFQNLFLAEKILDLSKLHKINNILLIGASYKLNTGIIEESATLNVVKLLLKRKGGIKMYIYDSISEALDNIKREIHDKIDYINSFKDFKKFLQNKKELIVAIMLPYEWLNKLPKSLFKNKIIIDHWGILKK